MKKIFCSIIMIFTLILTSSNILLAQDTSNDESVPYNQEEYQKIVDFIESEWKLSYMYPENVISTISDIKIAVFENGIDGIFNNEKPLGFIPVEVTISPSDEILGWINVTTIIKNADLLNYNISNPKTWEGIEWMILDENDVKTKRVSKIDFSKMIGIDQIGIYIIYEDEDNYPLILDIDKNSDKLSLRNFSCLSQLNCLGTSMAELDLFGCYNLEKLNCSNTKIDTLDLSSNNNLKVLDCSNTKMNTLDLSNCNNLEELNCSDTLINISTLDLSNNSNLKSLDCSNCNLNLKELIKIASQHFNIMTPNSFNQNILDWASYIKGDIKEFGNGESTTYEWYFENDDTPSTLPVFNGSRYDFTDYPDYIGKKIYCKISDSGITLTSNLTTITDSINDVDIEVNIIEAPRSIAKGDEPVKQQLKANAIPNSSYVDIDKSVRWEISYK